MRVKIAFILGFVFLAVSSKASDSDRRQHNKMMLIHSESSPALQEIARSIPRKLMNAGIYNLGKTDLKKFDEKIQQTNFRENNSLMSTVSGSRHSAFYEPRSKTLVINTTFSVILGRALSNLVNQETSAAAREETSVTVRQERLEPLLLHESLGANGINDVKYDKSLGAYILSTTRDEKVQETVRKYLQKSGGTTTVGGGGNDMSIWIKLKLLELSLDSSRLQSCADHSPADLMAKLLSLNIEGSFDCQNKDVVYHATKKEIFHCQTFFWWRLDSDSLANQTRHFEKFMNQFCGSLSKGSSK